MTKYIFTLFISLVTVGAVKGQTVVNSIVDLNNAVKLSNQTIVMTPGNYNFNELGDNGELLFSGSNNIVTLTGVYVEVLVGTVDENYIEVSGDNNIIIGGEFEDVYSNGLTEITDFSAYNQDRNNLAHGLGGDPVFEISGADNLVDGLKLTVRGSFPYGYGSMYGINQVNAFGLDKRCGLLINGPRNTLDNVEVQHRAFGHAIFMQGDADETVIKNTYVEGRTRPTGDLYYENQPYDLPFLSGFKMPYEDGNPSFVVGDVHSLCEDGIRQYTGVGSVTVENCTVKKTRGGMRLYLGGTAIVKNSTAIDCGNTNWNLPANAVVENSAGNFTNAPLRDNRLGRSGMTAEWTIIPSPNSGGTHNIADVLGSRQNLTFHRTDGPLDDKEKKAIVVEGDNSTIVNETEYTIILEASANGNKITSCGPVIDNGSGNTVIRSSCDFVLTCNNTANNLEAECYDNMSGVQTESIDNNNDAVSEINSGDWISFSDIDLTGMGTVTAITSSLVDGTSIEVRTGSNTGTLIGTIAVPNTSGFDTYEEVSIDLIQTFDAVTDIYFVFSGPNGFLFNVDEISFEKNLCTEIVDPILPIQLEDFCEASGVQLGYLINDNQEVNFIDNGDYLKFANVDFDNVSFNSIEIAAASAATGGTVELRIGTVDGTLLASVDITNTGGWGEYEMFNNFAVVDVSGVQDLFVVFTGGTGSLFNVDYLYLRNDPCLTIVDAFSKIEGVENCENSGVVAVDNDYVGSIHEGDWVRFGSVDFGSVSPSSITLNLSGQNNTDGFVNIMLNDPTSGIMVATATVPATGGWTNWQEVTVPVNVEVTGIQEVYVYFGGGSYNMDWFQFYKDLCSGVIKDVSKIEAEDYCEMSGIQTQASSEGTDNVGWINNGDWLKYSGLDLSNMNSIKARVSSKITGSVIEVHLDAVDGDLIAEIPVSNTDGNQNWVTDSVNIVSVSGIHDVYLVFAGVDGFLFNINHFGFSEERIVVTNINNSLFDGLNIYPNPTKDNIHVSGVIGSSIELYNHSGALEISETVSSSNYQLDMSSLHTGVYFIKILSKDGFIVEKIIKD